MSATIPLTLGIIAGTLFGVLFIGALIITMHNRRIVRRYAECAPEDDRDTI